MFDLFAYTTALPKEKISDNVERIYPLSRYYYYVDVKNGREPIFGVASLKKLSNEDLKSFETKNEVCKEEKRKLFKIYFDFNKFTIKPIFKKELENNFLKLKGKIKTVYISAYTDKVGSYVANQYIALMRANSVKKFLLQFTDKIYFKEIKGKCCYVSNNDALNRRAEIKVIYNDFCNKN